VTGRQVVGLVRAGRSNAKSALLLFFPDVPGEAILWKQKMLA
jgi:hypothetical protein